MTRRLVLTLLLYGLLVALAWLVPRGADDALSLMAYGLLIVAAFAGGDVAERLGVPRITAYLLTGLLVGPDALELLSRDLIGPVYAFDGGPVLPLTVLALGLMGMRTGAGLRLADLREQSRDLAVVCALQIAAVCAVSTALALGALSLGLGPDVDTELMMPMAVLVGLILVGASPASTVGVLDETGARGPVGGLTLASAAVRDFLLPALFVVGILAVGLSPRWSLLPWMAVVFGPLIGGALLGARFVNARDTPLLTITVVLVVGFIFAHQMPYGPFLLFMCAGLVLGNAGSNGAHVLSALGTFATPVYVLFFATLGAAFPLHEAAAGAAVGAVLAVGRVVALLVAGRLAGRFTQLDRRATSLLGIGSAPLAGTAVCLALLSAELLPVVGSWVRDTVLAAIIVSEVVGPFLLQLLLGRVGEFVRVDDAPAPQLPPAKRIIEVGAELPPPPSSLPPELVHPLDALRTTVQEEMDNFADALATALTEGPFRYLSSLEVPPDEERDATLRKWGRAATRYSGETTSLDTLHRAIEELFGNLETQLQGVRPTSVVETQADRASQPGDSRWIRVQKFFLRAAAAVGLRRGARRVVQLDHLVQFHLIDPIPNQLVPITHLALRAAVLPLIEIDRRVRDTNGLTPPDPIAVAGLRELGDDVMARAMLMFADAMDAIYKGARVAGTPSLPPRQIKPGRRDLERTEGHKRLAEAVSRWQSITHGQAGRLSMRIHTELRRPPVAAAYATAAAATWDLLERSLVLPLTQLRAEVNATLVHLGDVLSKEDAADRVRAVADGLLELTQRSLRDLDRRKNRGELTGFLAPLWAELDATIADLPARLLVPTYNEPLAPEGLSVSARQASLSPIDAQDVARVALVDEAAVNLVLVEERVAALVESSRAALMGAAQIVRFHLDATAAEVADGSTEAQALAREFGFGGLQRVIEQLKDMLEALDTTRAELCEHISSEGLTAQQRLVRLLVEELPDQASQYVAQRRHHGPSEGEAASPRDADRVLNALRRGFERFSTRGEDDTGTDETFPFRMAARATLAHVTELGIPETYRRLFNFNPVGLDDFFVGRDFEYRALRAALDRWRKGSPTAVLLTGARGSGRTSLIDRLLRHLPPGVGVARAHLTGQVTSERALLRELGAGLGFKRLTSSKRLTEHLLTHPQPLVFVVEPLSRLHRRSRDGLEALRTLRRLVSATAHRVLWVVAADPVALNAVKPLVAIDTAFTEVIDLPALRPEMVEALITARHRASGYKIRYQEPASGFVAQAELRTRFFEVLTERAHGMPLLCVYEWLRSLRFDAQGQAVVVESPKPLELAYVDQLTEADLLLVAQVHIHAGLTPSDAAKVASVEQEGAVGRLRRLAWRHFLDEPEPERFVINPVMWPRLRRALYKKGVL